MIIPFGYRLQLDWLDYPIITTLQLSELTNHQLQC
jgi:hypothetical protein